MAGAELGGSPARAGGGGKQDGGCGRGSSLFSSPLTRLLLPRRRPRSRRALSRRPRPAREAPCFSLVAPPPAQSLVPVGPAAPSLALSGPAATPITSAAGPAPPFGAPGRGRAGRRAGRRGPGSGARPPPALASAATAVPPPGPRWGPGPAAAAAPGGGGGMKPLPPPLPPRSPAEGREGSAPRQDPPLRPPPRHLHPFPRSLPGSAGSPAEQELERERGGNGKKIPPPVPGAAAAGAARRGARSRRRHGAPSPARPHGGGADAAGARSRDGVCPRRGQGSPQPSLRRGASPTRERGRWGLLGKDGDSLTL